MTTDELVDFIRDQVCCVRSTGGCEVNDSAECPAQLVRAAITAAYCRGWDAREEDLASSVAHLGAPAHHDYAPRLMRFTDPPRLEYVIADVPVVSRRIDDLFDLLLDIDTRLPVGFRLHSTRPDILREGPGHDPIG